MKRTISVISIFPALFTPFASLGVIGRGLERQEVQLNLVDLRDYSDNNYKSVDDTPFGGGAGMILRPDILKRALFEGVVEKMQYGQTWEEISARVQVICPSAKGPLWTQAHARRFAHQIGHEERDLIFICGRYEGIDERFLQKYVHHELSIGDFVVSGGEMPAMLMIDSLLRLLPGFLGNQESILEESFSNSLLECGQYTKPRIFEEMEVPAIYLSGHHKKIRDYRLAESIALTKVRRPDLYARYLAEKGSGGSDDA